MKIRREDLVAAASEGLLQPRQIGPLFLFLLQRDVRARRMALARQVHTTQRHSIFRMLFYMAGFTAATTTLLFAVLLSTQNPTGTGALFFFSMLYMLCAAWVVKWFRSRRFGKRIRMLPALAVAALPLSMIVVKQVAAG